MNPFVGGDFRAIAASSAPNGNEDWFSGSLQRQATTDSNDVVSDHTEPNPALYPAQPAITATINSVAALKYRAPSELPPIGQYEPDDRLLAFLKSL